MRFNVFYGAKPQMSAKDKSNFSRGNYICHTLLQTAKGLPVVISKHKDEDFPVWSVAYGTFHAVFGSYEESMAFCRGRFYDLDGKLLRR